MSWQIIHDDDVAATEGSCEALFDVRQEDGAVHRSINHEGSDNPVVAQAGDESDCFPMSMRNRCDQPLPPLRFGAALPVSLQRWHHRTTELTPTLKISAISRRDAPLSTASTARSRKSVEYGLGIDLAPQANQFSPDSPTRQRLGIPSIQCRREML